MLPCFRAHGPNPDIEPKSGLNRLGAPRTVRPVNRADAFEVTEAEAPIVGGVHRRFAAALVSALALLFVACGGSSARSPSSPDASPSTGTGPSVEEGRGDWLVASVPRGTFGPHWARRNKARLAVWAVPQGAASGWYSLSLPADDALPGAPLRLGDVPSELRMMQLRPDGSGFTLLTARRVQEAHLIEAYQLGPEGVLRSGPHLLGESPASILWLDAIPTPRGALVVWAERVEGGADVYVVPSGPLGADGPPRRLVRRAVAWQLAAFGRSAALATVEDTATGRDVFVHFVGDDGRDAAPAARVSSNQSAQPEVDLWVHRERSVIAWTEQRASGRRLMLAELGRDGSLKHPPWPATPPRGDQTLIELIGSADGGPVYVAWEEQARRPLSGSTIALARIGEPGMPLEGPAAEIDVHGYDGTLPLFAAHARGVLAATRAPVCPKGEATCQGNEDAVVAIHLDEDLTPAGVVPVRAGASSASAEFLWDLECEEECWALTAPGAEVGSPSRATHVHFTRLPRDPGWHSPAYRVRGHTLPHTERQLRVSTALPLEGLQAWQGPQGPVLAWLSYFDPWTPWVTPKKPAPDGRLAPVRAILRAQGLVTDADQEEVRVAAEETISWRAHSPGGLSVAPGRDSERLLLWSALDGGQPQVFGTLVDEQGKRLRQRMLTRTAGEVQNVAAVRLDSSWLLAWVDGRDGANHVYGLRVDDRLEALGSEVPLSRATRDPTGVHLLRRGELVLATWSDVSTLDVNVSGDIYLALLSAHDGRVLTQARRITTTPLHSHSPRLVPYGRGSLLAWLEVDHDTDEPPALLVLELDEAGRPLGRPRSIHVEGRPATFTLDCEDVCRAVVTVDRGSRGELWGLRWAHGELSSAEPSVRLLTTLAGRQAEAVAPVLLGDSVFYVDGDDPKHPGLHRLDAVWR